MSKTNLENYWNKIIKEGKIKFERRRRNRVNEYFNKHCVRCGKLITYNNKRRICAKCWKNDVFPLLVKKGVITNRKI
jgi:hypothetical protein